MPLANGRAKAYLMFAGLIVLALRTIALHAVVPEWSRYLEDR